MPEMKSAKEIQDMFAEACNRELESSRFWGMSYEQGIAAALRWVLGEEETDDPLL